MGISVLTLALATPLHKGTGPTLGFGLTTRSRILQIRMSTFATLNSTEEGRLNLVTEKCSQKVHPSQSLLLQLLKGLAQGLQLAEILPSHAISLRR
jgi:hypothetical protein